MSMKITSADCERLVALLTEVNIGADVPQDNTDLGPIQDRLAKVLDALASLLISCPTKEVIAVGLQMGSTDGNSCYTLTLASNNSITQETLAHCHRIVKHLKQLGAEFYDLRKNTTDPTTLVSMEGELAESPKLEERKFSKKLRLMVDSFKMDVHKFSLPKFRKRLNKPSGSTTRHLAFRSYVNNLPDSNSPTVRSLKDIDHILSWAANLLQNYPEEIPEDDLDAFAEGMDRIDVMVRKMIKTNSWMVQLLDVAPEPTFPLERFLRKISSIPNAFDILLKCAHSPRLYRLFFAEQEIKVKILRNQPQQIRLPTSDQWAETSKQILSNSAAGLSLYNDKEENPPGYLLRRRLSGVEIICGPVHCECLLALHLVSENRTGIIAVQYLGVSKLSCLACWEFLKVLRGNGIMFYTKGSHAKAYFPWKFPEQEINRAGLPEETQTRLTTSFFTNMSEIYVQRLREQERIRKLSDSSTGSAGETEHVWKYTMDRFKW
ncbi:hypothetical protein EMCG_07049 [[Emmonsia] crescens]|uniref:Uncharacterized protein n=1 Tax=[Emmonsia] crescens TaxID=73230 RepID=A0A0G2J623_9EURO|nr:hypothetical protein EMCG_07049 [Emmonsia crescens UAMH 3008]